MTLSGSGFGTKANAAQKVSAAPLVWDVTAEQFVGGENRDAYRGLRDGGEINTRVWQKVRFGAGDITRLSTSRSHRHPHVTVHYTNNGSKLILGTAIYPDDNKIPPATQKSFYLSFYRRVKFPCDGKDYCAKQLRVDTPKLNLVGTTFSGATGICQRNSKGLVTAWVNEGKETDWVRWEMYVDLRKQFFDVWKNGHYHLGHWSGANGSVELRPAKDWRFAAPPSRAISSILSCPTTNPFGPRCSATTRVARENRRGRRST